MENDSIVREEFVEESASEGEANEEEKLADLNFEEGYAENDYIHLHGSISETTTWSFTG